MPQTPRYPTFFEALRIARAGAMQATRAAHTTRISLAVRRTGHQSHGTRTDGPFLMVAMKPVIAVACLAAVAISDAALGGGRTATVRIAGAPDAVVTYQCDFAGGGNDAGRIRPPFQDTWQADGLSCEFRQIQGHQGVTIELSAGASVSQVTTAGRGSRVRLEKQIQ